MKIWTGKAGDTDLSNPLNWRDVSGRLYIVGRWKGGTPGQMSWDFQGIFDAEEHAEAACRDCTYSYWPVTLNQALPDETVPMEPGWPKWPKSEVDREEPVVRLSKEYAEQAAAT